jgi:glycosyltransferase involved in cell wall biosynthesis
MEGWLRQVEMSNRETRIVYDGTIFTSQINGGISRFFRRLIEEMARTRPGWIFDLHIVEDGRTPAALPSGENIRITRRKHLCPGWCWLPVNSWRRQAKIREARPAILHTTLARPLHFVPCPLVTTIHDAIMEKFPEFYAHRRHARSKRWWRWSATFCDAITTVSETSRSDIINTWSTAASKIHVTYPGVEEVFREPIREEGAAGVAGLGIQRPYILYVGHRGEHKNFQVLAKAMRDSALAPLDLVLVGGADEVPELENWPGLEAKRLHHIKRVSDLQLHWFYAGARALVFPSLYEGFGFPLIEAMSSGTPVVASDIPSSREVCGDAAEFFLPRDSNGCVEAIRRALHERNAISMTRKGKERAKLFSWSSCAEQTLAVYEGLIEARSSGFKTFAA